MRIRRTLLLSALAVVIPTTAIGIAVVHDRDRTDQHRAELQRTAILQRRIPHIHLDAVPADEAFPEFERITGIKTRASLGHSTDCIIAPLIPISLDFTDATVGELMDAMTEQVRRNAGWCGYEMEGDSLAVGPNADLRHIMVVYDVHDLLASEPSTSLAADGEFASTIQWFFQPRQLSFVARQRVRPLWWPAGSGRIAMFESSVMHRQFNEFLDCVRRAKSDGTGPAVSRLHVDDIGSVDHVRCYRAELRIYEVRDLSGRAVFATPRYLLNDGSVFLEAQRFTGAAAIAVMLASQLESAPRYASFLRHIHPIARRVIVDDQPEVQARVRRILGEVRSGQQLYGLSLSPSN